MNVSIKLNTLPLTARWLITLVLVSFALTHLFSMALVWEVTRNVDASAHEHFSYKSLAVLLRMGHQHTFGHGVMYGLTGAIFLFAGASQRWTLAVITGAFFGAWLDLGSWFLLKFYSENWEYLSMFAGGLFSLSFAAMLLLSLRALWTRPTR